MATYKPQVKQANGTMADLNLDAATLNGKAESTLSVSYATSAGHADEANKLKTIVKTYSSPNYYGTGDNWTSTTWYFMYVKPDEWYKPCRVRFKVESSCAANAGYRSYTQADILLSQGVVRAYANWNAKESYTHYYTVVNYITKAGFNAGKGYAIGISIRYAANYTNSSYPRTFRLEYESCENGMVTILDTPVKNTELDGRNSSNSLRADDVSYSMDAATSGLQETCDVNEWYRAGGFYSRYTVGSTGLYFGSICLTDVTGKLHSLVTLSSTGTTKSKSSYGFFPVNTHFYYYNGTNYSANNIASDAALNDSYSLIDFRYSSNCGTTLAPNKPVYLVGVLSDDGKSFKLADTWWTQTLPMNADNKIYFFMGTAYPDNSSTASTNYRISWQIDHTPYWYNAEKESVEVYTGKPQATPSGGGKLYKHTIEMMCTMSMNFDEIRLTYYSTSEERFYDVPSLFAYLSGIDSASPAPFSEYKKQIYPCFILDTMGSSVYGSGTAAIYYDPNISTPMGMGDYVMDYVYVNGYNERAEELGHITEDFMIEATYSAVAEM